MESKNTVLEESRETSEKEEQKMLENTTETLHNSLPEIMLNTGFPS